MNQACGSVLSIDIGGSKIIAAVVDVNGDIRGKIREPLVYPYTCADVLAAVLRLGHEALKQFGGDVICCAAAIPGLADPERGDWIYSSFSGIRDFPIAKNLSDEFGMPVFIDNDVKACAMGEMRFGACKNVGDFLWVTVSNGIGGCAVVNGAVLRGANNNAGEVGHINVVEDGFPCACGNRGCAEAYAAGPAIMRRYLALEGCPNAAGLNAESIARFALCGDKNAQKAYADTGYYLGKAIAAAVNALNPRKVILGGGVSMSMGLFEARMRQTLDKLVFREANRDMTVEKTALGYDAALIGAAALGIIKSEELRV